MALLRKGMANGAKSLDCGLAGDLHPWTKAGTREEVVNNKWLFSLLLYKHWETMLVTNEGLMTTTQVTTTTGN